MKMILKCISASAIFFYFAFIVFDGPVLTMQSDLNMNADPFIPQQQQQRQRQPEHVQANLYSVLQHPQIQPFRQNYRNLPSPPRIHSPKLSASPVMSPLLPIHYDSNLREEHGEHEEESYEFDDLMKHVVDFVVGSEEEGTGGSGHIGGEDWRSMNSYAPSDDHNSLQHLTPLLQTITSPVSKIPASITGSNPVPIQSPTKTISHTQTSTSVSHKIIPSNSNVKEASTDKMTFGTIEDNMLKPMSEKPKSQEPLPEFPAKSPPKTECSKQELGNLCLVKEMPKYLETLKKPSPSTSRNHSPSKEAQIKPISPNKVETSKSDLSKAVEVKKTPIDSSSTVGQSTRVNLPKSEQKLAVSPPNLKMPSHANKIPGSKKKETKKERWIPKGNKHQGTSGKVDSDWTCKHDKGIEIECVNVEQKTEGNPTDTGKGSRSRNKMKKENPKLNEFITQAEMARKEAKGKAKELCADDEHKESATNNIILESEYEDDEEDDVVEHLNSDDYSDDAQPAEQDEGGMKEGTQIDALHHFNEKEEKKKSAKQLRREKEIADKKAFEEFAEKRKKELEEQKRKAEMKPTEELNKEDAEKAAKNKENIKAAKGWMEFSKKAGKGKLAEMYKNADKGKPENNQWLLDLEEKIKASKSEPSIQLSAESGPADSQQQNDALELDTIEVTSEVDQKSSIDHDNEIKTLLSILKYDEIMRIAKKHDNNEELVKKDIRYLLFAIQLFYDSFIKYWHKNYKFHDKLVFAYIGDVLTKIGQFYTNNGTIEENVKLPKRTEESLEKCIHILAEIWTVPKYKEIMVAEQYKNEKYTFINWMEALEQLLEGLKLFYKKLKRFNRQDASKKTVSKLISKFKTSIQQYHDTRLNSKFRTIIGIVFIGIDKQNLGKILSKRKVLTGLNYLKSWLPKRKLELAHARKIMWHYYDIESYLWEHYIRANMNTEFKKNLGFLMPKGNYIEIKNYVHGDVETAVKLVDFIHRTISKGGSVEKVTPVIEDALDVFKEHILCDNFLLTMYRKIIQTQNDVNLANKHNVHMQVDRRIFWKIVDADRCVPAEENFKKILEIPEYQEFLKSNYSFNKIIYDALRTLENLKLNYNFDARRKEVREECDCCKPEEGYDKDSEEEKEELKVEKKMQEEKDEEKSND